MMTEVRDSLVVRPVTIIRMSDSLTVTPVEGAAEQVCAFESPQPEVAAGSSISARFAYHASLTKFFGMHYTTAMNPGISDACGRAITCDQRPHVRPGLAVSRKNTEF